MNVVLANRTLRPTILSDLEVEPSVEISIDGSISGPGIAPGFARGTRSVCRNGGDRGSDQDQSKERQAFHGIIDNCCLITQQACSDPPLLQPRSHF